jgi:uncharacterized membrane protein YhaH (DUF805 family)
MRFEQAVREGFRHYADFSGRATRPEFWWWILFTTLVSAALSALPVGPTVWTAVAQHSVAAGGSLASAWSIAVLLPTLALTVRRLRDGTHGWGHIFWIFLPIAGLIILIVLCAQPSTPSLPVAGTPDDATVPAVRP